MESRKQLGRKSRYQWIFVMSDEWMDEYTYQIVVRKEFLTAEQLAALKQSRKS